MRTKRSLRAAQLLVVLAGTLVAYLLKRYYSTASAEQLEWILRPTVTLVELLRGIQLERIPDQGFLARNERFLVAPVCAGVNFLVAACLIGCIGLVSRMKSPRACLALFAGTLGAAYLAAVVSNAARITLAMTLHLHPQWSRQVGLSGEDAHRLLGVVLYNFALLALFALAHRLLERSTHEAS